VLLWKGQCCCSLTDAGVVVKFRLAVNVLNNLKSNNLTCIRNLIRLTHRLWEKHAKFFSLHAKLSSVTVKICNGYQGPDPLGFDPQIQWNTSCLPDMLSCQIWWFYFNATDCGIVDQKLCPCWPLTGELGAQNLIIFFWAQMEAFHENFTKICSKLFELSCAQTNRYANRTITLSSKFVQNNKLERPLINSISPT